ncbi:unnamed protein product, partial [Amoebophrya sp. A25]
GLESKCQTLIRVRGNGNRIREITHLFSHTQYVESKPSDKADKDAGGAKAGSKAGEKQSREYVVVYSRLQYLCLQRNPLESFIICRVGGNHVASKLLPSLVELYLDIVRTKPYKFYEDYSRNNTSVDNSVANSSASEVETVSEVGSSSAADAQEKGGAFGCGARLLRDHMSEDTEAHVWTEEMLAEDEPENFLKRNVLVYLKNLPRLWVLQLNMYYPSRRTGLFSWYPESSGVGLCSANRISPLPIHGDEMILDPSSSSGLRTTSASMLKSSQEQQHEDRATPGRPGAISCSVQQNEVEFASAPVASQGSCGSESETHQGATSVSTTTP